MPVILREVHLVIVSEFSVMCSLNNLMVKAGLSGLSIHYLGGMKVLLSFDDASSAELLRESKDVWSPWFTSLDSWKGQHLPFQIIAWLRIIGIPLHLSEVSVFNLVADQFGKVIHGSEISWNNRDF